MKGQDVRDLFVNSPFVIQYRGINALVKHFHENAETEVDLHDQEELIRQIILLNQEVQLWASNALRKFDPEAIQRVKDAATKLVSGEQYSAQNSEK